MAMRGLHAFNWDLNSITESLPVISDTGYNYVQISPICPSKATDRWEWLYQQLDFSVGNHKGSEYDLWKLCNEADKRNIKICADFVPRHMAGRPDSPLTPHELVNPEILNRPEFWLPIVHVRDTRNMSRYETVKGEFGMPPLNYNNEELQERFYKPFISRLRDRGVKMIRIDQAKHIETDTEGGTFFKNVVGSFKDIDWAGECIDLSTDILAEYQKYIKTIIASWTPTPNQKMTIAFFESHDSFLSAEMGYSKNWCDDSIMYNYNDICGKFENTLYFARPFNDHITFGNAIRQANINHR